MMPWTKILTFLSCWWYQAVSSDAVMERARDKAEKFGLWFPRVWDHWRLCKNVFAVEKCWSEKKATDPRPWEKKKKWRRKCRFSFVWWSKDGLKYLRDIICLGESRNTNQRRGMNSRKYEVVKGQSKRKAAIQNHQGCLKSEVSAAAAVRGWLW